MKNRTLMLGNEAMALALVENGCRVAASYPGTPASEILPAVARLRNDLGAPMHAEWAVNEKVAFEIAYTAAVTGLRAAVGMKQVGLNVASDPLMSAAYSGVRGGFLVVSADDPGPHSSQTEQDSRLMAMLAKVPVLDPDSPAHARALIAQGFELSERFGIPVMIRPTTRVCHACQDILPGDAVPSDAKAEFVKEPSRWAATPVFRNRLHKELCDKIARIADWAPTSPVLWNPEASGSRAVIASGVAAAHAREVLDGLGLWDRIHFYQVVQPYPLHASFVNHILGWYDELLVLEEPAPVIEMQLLDRRRVRGKATGAVPEAGELLPETVERAIAGFAGTAPAVPVGQAPPPGRRPTLCAGCPHRASFYAIRRAAPEGIYPSDIGCYTLGLNLGAVDTVLCMGAAIGQAAGFHHAYRLSGRSVDIVATIGDSTFFHAGVPGLIDATVQGARFVLVILDNSMAAMTGFQPTPASGTGAGGEPTGVVDLEALVRACGVRFCKVGVPGRFEEFVRLLEEALAWSRENGVAVVIAREPCVMAHGAREKRAAAARPHVSDACTGCRHCISRFECPAILFDEAQGRASIDGTLCTGCGVCLHVCPVGAIRAGEGEASR